MPSLTYDGKSFMFDGRRLWLAGGSVCMSRVPREAWADRIHAAKLAGLNAIETPVIWARHESRPGHVDFTGGNDLRHFIELVGQAGMYAVLRVGPFVGAEWDFGGLPPWLMEHKDMKPRTGSGPFLEACSRWITALSEKIRDLQVTAPGRGGPLMMIQLEEGWTCGHETICSQYIGEIARYLREGGINVPTINTNNLWQSVEGQIDCWQGSERMVSTLRQLGIVRPAQPKLVAAFEAAPVQTLARETPVPLSPRRLQRRLAECLAGGGQFILRPFCASAMPGFAGGRLADSTFSFMSASRDGAAPVSITGSAGATLPAVKKIATFASRFARVFSNLESSYAPVGADPAGEGSGAAVVHVSGSQGGVAFVFGPDTEDMDAKAKQNNAATLLLPDGSNMPVHMGEQTVAWCLFNVHLTPRSFLDYCNLNALASVGKVLVLYGPAGAPGMLCLNGSPIEVTVPDAKATKPFITDHEAMTIVVLNEKQADAVQVSDEGVWVGASSLTADGRAIGGPGVKQCLKFLPDGTHKVVACEGLPSVGVSAGSEKVTINDSSYAPMTEYLTGESARYASIAGPEDLTRLGSPSGYGWYRVALKASSAHKAKVIFPNSGDRLHLFLDGEELGLVGVGPGAGHEFAIPVRKQPHNLVILAENLGRFAEGVHLGESKGVAGHFWECSVVKPTGPAKSVTGQPIEVLAFRAPLLELREGDSTLPERVTWTVPHRSKKSPMFVHLHDVPGRALLVVNDVTTAYVDPAGPSVVTLDAEKLGRGNATIQLAIIPDDASHEHSTGEDLVARFGKCVTFLDGEECLSESCAWAFAKWEVPNAAAFQKGQPKGKHREPTWWRGKFTPVDTVAPLLLEVDELSKGQVYVNGQHVARYFAGQSTAAAAVKAVPGQTPILIPRAALKPGVPNEIVIFDEHGSNPAKCRLAYHPELRPIQAMPLPPAKN
jgi:beta-galactosidase